MIEIYAIRVVFFNRLPHSPGAIKSLVTFDRLKQNGEKHKNQFVITDPLMRSMMSKYYLSMPEGKRSGRFFRKVITTYFILKRR